MILQQKIPSFYDGSFLLSSRYSYIYTQNQKKRFCCGQGCRWLKVLCYSFKLTICNLNRFLRKVAHIVVRFPIIFLLLPCLFTGAIIIFNHFPLLKLQHRTREVDVRETFAIVDPNTNILNEIFNEHFQDTAIRLGAGRSFAKVILWTEDDSGEMLSQESCRGILQLHEEITSVEVRSDGVNITYNDVCIHSRSNRENGTSSCIHDPIISVCQSSVEKSHDAQFIHNGSTGEVYTTNYVNHADYKSNASMYLSVRLKKSKKTKKLTANLIQISYLLNQSANLAHENRMWLKEFDENRANFNTSAEQRVLFATSLTPNIAWQSWTSFNFFHFGVLCAVSFVSCFALAAVYSCQAATCFFHAVQSTASLALTLASIYSISDYVYGKYTDYNIVLVMALVTAAHVSSEISFITTYTKYMKEALFGRDDEVITLHGKFVKICEEMVIESFYCMGRHTFVFLIAALTSYHDPFRHMALTCGIGFVIVLFFHITFIPACFKLHRACVFCSNDAPWSDFSFTDSDLDRKDLDKPDQCRSRCDLKGSPGHSLRRCQKSKLTQASNDPNCFQRFRWNICDGFYNYIATLVTVHVRPFIMIIYVLYVSIMLVTCLSFTEQVSPVQFASNESGWYEFLEKGEDFRPRIVIAGRMRECPWEKNNLIKIARIHEDIMNSDNKLVYVDETTNWFVAYMKKLREMRKERKLEKKISNSTSRYHLLSAKTTPSPKQMTEDHMKNFLKNRPSPSKYKVVPVIPDATIVENSTIEQLNDSWRSFQREMDTSEFLVHSQPHFLNGTLTGDSPWWYFRMFYHTLDMKMAASKSKLAGIITNLPGKNTDDFQVYGDAEVLDWWRSVGSGKYFITLCTLAGFNLFTLLGVIFSGTSQLVHVWNIATSWSVGFGMVAGLSLFDMSLDTQTLTCILFGINFTSQVVWKPFTIFKGEEKLQGRAKRSEISTYESGVHVFFSSISLLFCIITFGFQTWPSLSSIRCSLISLAFLVAMHAYVVLPVLLTLAPPSARPRRVRVAQMFPANSAPLRTSSKYRVGSRLSRNSTMRSVRKTGSLSSKRYSTQLPNVPRVIVKDETSF